MIAIATLCCVTPAFAQITDMNLYGPGDGLATWDIQTRLQWVDLPETLGLSYNDVLASDLVTVKGFRHATAAEVETLFLNAGFLTTDNVNDPLNDPAADLLLDVMGCTQFCGTVNELGRGFADYSPGWTVRPNYHSGGLGSGAVVVSLFSSNFDLVDPTAGHFLVRYLPLPKPRCGIGCELALIIPLLVGLRRWARR
jgi:hypothetical protein